MVLFEKFVKLRRLRYLLADRGNWAIVRLAWALSVLSMVLISHPDVRNPRQIFLSL